MKPILAILLVILSLFSCTKEKPPTYADNIIGRWELSKRFGTFVGSNENYAPGNGAILEFTNNTYKQLFNSQVVISGSYNIEPDTMINSTPPGGRLTIKSNGTTIFHFVTISDNEIIVSDYGSDMEYKMYKRLQ